MERDSTGSPDAAKPEPLAHLVATQEQAVNQVRKDGRSSEIISAAAQAADAIQSRLSEPRSEIAGEEREALIAVKRFLFNAAADCWPGWSLESARGSDEELEAALSLARRSADLVDRLALGPMEEGTAQWLIGAFELALRQTDAALDHFSRAQALYERAAAPGLALLARGYGAIAHEAAGRAPSEGTSSLAETLAEFASRDLEDGKELSEQLVTARRIFA
jgi:hypothetical protein